MNIKEFSRNEIITVYTTHCTKYFPKKELKPVTSIEWLLNKKCYRGFGLYDNNQLLGCALLAQAQKQKFALLDYYAIFEEYRGLGIGGQFLSLLTESLSNTDGIFIETENPHFAQDKDSLDIQTRRIAFYTRNGAVKTPLVSTVFNVHYRILFLPLNHIWCSSQVAETYYQQLDALYLQIIPEKHYNTNVEITIL